jgi:nitrite reductase/ring-hydroxylating ferredoxin subunit
MQISTPLPLRATHASVRLCNRSDIPVDEGLRVETPFGPVAVFVLNDVIYAVQNTCTHAGASLADGRCRDGWVECPVHRGRFDLITGAAIKAPCTIPIKTYKLRLVGDEVHLHREETSDATPAPGGR